ncbi:MAG: 3'-5' exonuclease [Bacteroidota bacterium]|nr:3'-5' exonuclease [Bacteroidota bacterium]
MNETFVSIDFETATGKRNSACAVAIVTVENGRVTDEYYTLIQPPENKYFGKNIEIHKITPEMTENSKPFNELYPEIKQKLEGKTVVAHNAPFDRSVLKRTMELYNLDYSELQLADKWDCTLSIYRSKGYYPASLDACCRKNNIELNHHEALSDAKACAELYMLR